MTRRPFPLSGAFPAPAFVVTARAGGRRSGCVVGFTWFVGAIVQRVDLGDHVGCVLHPERWHDGGPIEQLTVRDLAGVEPGHPA